MMFPTYGYFYFAFFCIVTATWLYSRLRVSLSEKRELERLKRFAVPARMPNPQEQSFISRVYFDYCRAIIGITILFVFIALFFAFLTYYVELEQNDPIPYFVIAGLALAFLIPLLSYLTTVLGSVQAESKKPLYIVHGTIQIIPDNSLNGHTHPAILRQSLSIANEQLVFLAFRVEKNTIGIDVATDLLADLKDGDLVSAEFTPLTKTILTLKRAA